MTRWMRRASRLTAAVRAWLTAAPSPRFSGCEAHFAERLGLTPHDRR